MWIRDSLPNDLLGVRTIVYGYDSKLVDSSSFQSIRDLACTLITQLETYGWTLSSAKPLCFLAHSLGGLVLREAMVQLDSSKHEGYSCLLKLIRGAVFFGVPNRGMEQSHFLLVTGDNANAELIEDIGRNSNYLNQLNKSFSKASFQDRMKFFWAYETSRSPTLRVSLPASP